MKTEKLRLSIAGSYDHRKTGDRYTVTTYLNDVTIGEKPITDPFIHTSVRVHWWDAIRALLRHGCIIVRVIVRGDAEIMEDVLELDENYIGYGSTRRSEFRAGIEGALSAMAETEPTPRK